MDYRIALNLGRIQAPTPTPHILGEWHEPFRHLTMDEQIRIAHTASRAISSTGNIESLPSRGTELGVSVREDVMDLKLGINSLTGLGTMPGRFRSWV